MTRLLQYPAGRRSKWLVLVVMLLLAAAAGSQSSKLEDAQENDPSSFLPGESESVEALEAAERFPSGELTPAIAVFRRDGGLTGPDRARITEATNELGQLAARYPRQAGGITPPQLSRDASAVLVVVPLKPEGESDVLLERTDDIREIVGGVAGAGLEAKVTGPAGYSADAIEVFSSIDSTLLISTAGLVFVLLILIYRSPIFWIIPLFAVAMVESSARGLGYLMTELGVTINGQSAGVLVVLVFGAGTDYALLLVARYREELRKHEDNHEAMRIALGQAGPTIFASGLTTVLALLCLSLADLNATAGLGPVGAAGIALAVAFMLSLLPVLLLVGGRRAFWPYVPRYGSEGADELHGFWRRVGDRIRVRPRRVWVATLGVLAVMALGLVSMNDDLTTGNGFRGDVESVDGQALLAKSFPAGSTAPTFVVVRDPWSPAQAQRAVRGVDGVAAVGPVERGEPGGRFDVTLEPAPYSAEAFAVIPRVRQALDDALRGPSDRISPALVGGPTAEEHDLRVASARDNRLIIPLILVVVFLILAFVLRAVYAAVLLIGTVIASYLAALGFASVLFEHIVGYPGIDPTLPLFAFTFLIALGVDYNIFLMARVQEEARTHGTAEGTLRGLAVTGGVITSAGIVLAGTFSFLAILPLYALTEIGVTIVFGVLLDTFIVRSILVPALALDIGDRIWWPRPLR